MEMCGSSVASSSANAKPETCSCEPRIDTDGHGFGGRRARAPGLQRGCPFCQRKRTATALPSLVLLGVHWWLSRIAPAKEDRKALGDRLRIDDCGSAVAASSANAKPEPCSCEPRMDTK